MSKHPEVDLSGVRRRSIAERARKVDHSLLGRVAQDPASFEGLWDGLPDILAARDLRRLVKRIVEARLEKRPVLLFMGGHVVKTGLVPFVTRLMEEGLLTLVASHGAGLVHDVESSLFGRTSEDVDESLDDGEFGMDEEASLLINTWTSEAMAEQAGLGEGIGRRLRAALEDRGTDPDASWLSAAYGRGIPATLHVAIGTDVFQQHPEFDGAALGETSARDFRILAGHVAGARGGVVLNWGSAVILPEVFLKALSVARNLGHPAVDLTTAAFDFIRHYRPAENVVRRPTRSSGWGVYLVGHHEVLVPLFTQGLLLEWERARGGRSRGK
jgi:deoxyhypusine synthase